MKALTITQPWATLIDRRLKRIETRSWYTHHRGELVIHAAKTFPLWARQTVYSEPFSRALSRARAADLPLGVALCVVELVAVVRTEDVMSVAAEALGRQPSPEELAFGDYTPGRFAWLTRYLRPIENRTPVRGALGLWEYPG